MSNYDKLGFRNKWVEFQLGRKTSSAKGYLDEYRKSLGLQSDSKNAFRKSKERYK